MAGRSGRPPGRPTTTINGRALTLAQRKERFLENLPHTKSILEALRDVGVQDQAYRNWRMRDPNFAMSADLILARKKVQGQDTESRYRKSFAEFRHEFFGRVTPAFQEEMVYAYEHTAPGNITMILTFPESGKTTLFEDYASYKLAFDPSFRFTVGGESLGIAKKILGRVRNRMEPQGPYPRFVAMYGPFVPQKVEDGNTRQTRQLWSDEAFNIYKKSDHDERDYSMVALGFNARIAGTRTDHLHGDDLSSLSNYNQTENLIERFRQDWLSRPGERGRTTLNGTRVGEDDFYEVLEREIDDDILKVVRMPAIVFDRTINDFRPLWPYDPESNTGYTMEQLERQRKKVGEDAWARNYMQQPRAARVTTFTMDMLGKCLNPTRSVFHDPDRNARILITLDPSIGGRNCFMVMAMSQHALKILQIREDTNLMSTDAIMNVLEELCHQYAGVNGAQIDTFVVETMAFQKGLIQDQRLERIQKRFGFRSLPHLTGSNKYDENVGVPAMATNFIREEIDIPWAEDNWTRLSMEQFTQQLCAWKPNVRGTRLRQDQVMAFWFGWIYWRDHVRAKQVLEQQPSIKMQGLPYIPTQYKPMFGSRR